MATLYINESPNGIHLLNDTEKDSMRRRSLASINEINQKINSDLNDSHNSEKLRTKRLSIFGKKSALKDVDPSDKRRHSTYNILGLGIKTSSKDKDKDKEKRKEHRRSSLALFGNLNKERRSSLALNSDSKENVAKSNRRSSLAVHFSKSKKELSKSQGALDEDEVEPRRSKSTWQVRKRRTGATNGSDFGTPERSRPHSPDRSIENLDEVELNERYFEPNKRRLSWWNVLLPENLKSNRSRRSSQDINAFSRSVDHLAPLPLKRSKSRSVDHGLTAPYDLDTLRSKVEGRIESVDRLAKAEEERKRALAQIPTVPYTVGDRDTLTSVAARFDTTPSELTAINRLGSNFIFPGQVLQVPSKKSEGISINF
ncbi:DNA topoisomerase 1-like [Ctenocephalides felis]|uniref:DNA topoisomerase 1-like n=1 Tax=Ctenocephalides felis TaxID=7515 RepID=UPI000E6E3CAD|nr:DNA topoisomerase 1-like [Ctenocephalides felis]